MGLAQHEAVGDVEEVVAGDAQVDGLRVLGPAAVFEHPLVVGVHLDLRLVGRLGPAVPGRVDALHRQVRALDDAQLDRRAAAAPARDGPCGEGPLHAMRVGQVGLQHDSRAQGQELRLVQNLAERGHREVEVAVLLHVEVDELRRDPSVGVAVPMAGGRPVERSEPLGDACHGRAKGDEIDLAEDRRDLHRDVLDVVASEQREVRLEAARRLRLAQDRLAELVEVQPHARPSPLLEVAAEVFLFAGQDDVLGLVAQSVHDGGHHQAGEVVRHGSAQEERGALPPVHVPGHPVALEEVGELVGDALGAVAPEGLIGERDRQLLAMRIGHHAGELLGLGVLFRGLLGARLAKERFGELDGAVGEALFVRRVVRGAHRRSRTSVYGASGPARRALRPAPRGILPLAGRGHGFPDSAILGAP